MAGDPFIIYALPRSRTAWLSTFLTVNQWTCHHDAVVHFNDIHDVPKFLSAPFTGMCETGMGFAGAALSAMVPNAKIVVIERPKAEIKMSLEKLGVKLPDAYYDREIANLRQISELNNSLTIEFKDLTTQDGCAAVFEHCLEMPMIREWWSQLKDENIQVDFAQSMERGRQHSDAIEDMRRQCEAFMSEATVQNETWADFFPQGRALIEEHYAEVGSIDGLPFDPNYDLVAKMDKLGMLQITTARVAGAIVGYLVCQIEPHFESKAVLRGVQTIFFVRKEFRGKTGTRLHAFARDELQKKGVKFLTMRSGVRGVGAKQDALFRRLGAKEDGHMYTLKLGA